MRFLFKNGQSKHFSKHFDLALFSLAIFVIAVSIICIGINRIKKAVEKPALIFTHWQFNETEENLLDELIAEFENKYTDIKIIQNKMSFEDCRQLFFKYTDREAEPFISGSHEAEAVENYGDIIAFDGFWEDNSSEDNILDISFFTPLPVFKYFYTFFYNTKMLKDAGIIKPPKNQKEFLAMANLVTNRESGQYALGFAFGTDDPSGANREIYPWFASSGISALESGKLFNDTLLFFSRLKNENLIHPGSFSFTNEEKLSAFANNEIAFMTAPMQDIKIIQSKMDNADFNISTVPAADSYNGKPAFISSEWKLGIFKESKHKEEAQLFISFLAQNSSTLADKAGMIAGSENNRAMEPVSDPVYSKVFELYAAGDFYNSITINPEIEDLAKKLREE